MSTTLALNGQLRTDVTYYLGDTKQPVVITATPFINVTEQEGELSCKVTYTFVMGVLGNNSPTVSLERPVDLRATDMNDLVNRVSALPSPFYLLP